MRKKFQNFFKKVTENNIPINWRCATIKKSKINGSLPFIFYRKEAYYVHETDRPGGAKTYIIYSDIGDDAADFRG